MIAHVTFLKLAVRAEDVIRLIVVVIGNLQDALLAVELDGYGIEVVIVAFFGELDVDRMSVEHRPCTVEVVTKDARVPIGVDVRIAAEVDNDIFVEIEQIAAHGREEFHFAFTERNGNASIRRLNIDGAIFESCKVMGSGKTPSRFHRFTIAARKDECQ